uniref:Integrin subunit alpha L n=1 Tax=Pipistrellus kuhlii TaxID=59472 RepID=A0A7J7S687_PIPKU|nr:integrin subunit alpha L [Pipistrellus kuhlii]
MNACSAARLLLSGPFLLALASGYNLDVRQVQNLSFPDAGRHFGYRVLQLDNHRVWSRGLFPGGRRELHGNVAVTSVESCIAVWFHFPIQGPAADPLGQPRRGADSE